MLQIRTIAPARIATYRSLPLVAYLRSVTIARICSTLTTYRFFIVNPGVWLSCDQLRKDSSISNLKFGVLRVNTVFDVLIIGGGLSGLSVAHFLQMKAPDLQMAILEKDFRPGGAIRSHSEGGFLAEWGPHGFLDNVEASREILADTGLDHEAQKAPLGDFVRYICLDGKLNMIPQNPKKIIASSLLPLSKKLRVLADLWKKPIQEEQSVSQWASYRFGKGILPFVDAVFTGTYAGDFERLSIDAVMPGVRELEKSAGSVIRGLLQKKKKADREKPAKAKGGLPSMVSFAQGMGRLPEALARDRKIFFDNEVRAIRKTDGLWEIATAQSMYHGRTLVIALPVNQMLALLESSGLIADNKPPLVQIPEARIVTVVMGFTDAAQIPFGFGYLAPEQENRFALGALFSTHMFPGRAPDGHVMLEALVGGRRHPEKLALSDKELITNSYNDLKQLMHLPKFPSFSKVLKTNHGIPQLELGYPRLLSWCNALQKSFEGLHICGFGWGGIGINDMTKRARTVAEAVRQGAVGDPEKAAVKGVYF